MKRDYNISVDDYRYKFKWYPRKDITHQNAKELFHNITYELNEIIEKIEISTMSLEEPKLKVAPSREIDKKYATFTTQYTDTYGRCYTMNATNKTLALGITKVTIVTRIGVYVFLDHPGQHLHVNSRSKVRCYDFKWINKCKKRKQNIKYLLLLLESFGIFDIMFS